MKKFKNDTKGKSNKVLRAKEGDFLQGVADLSDVAGSVDSPYYYKKYLASLNSTLNPLYLPFEAVSGAGRMAGKALYEKLSPFSDRSSLENKAFNDATTKMVSGIKVPENALNKTAVSAASVSPPVAASTSSPKSRIPIASVPASADSNKSFLDYKSTPINYQLGKPTTNNEGPKSVVATPDVSQGVKSVASEFMGYPEYDRMTAPNMTKAAGELPKTKSGMKKFMDEYGKFIALGALSGFGGKKGMIAAPIMAALPGILKMLQNRGKKNTGAPTAPDTKNAAHGGLLGNKSAAHPKNKMAVGSIRKFNGGSMNTFKYRDGGKPKLPASTLIPDNILFNDTDAAKQMLGRLVYEQNRPSSSKVKSSPRKYSPREDYQPLLDPDVESMSTKYLEDAPDLVPSYKESISGIDERTALPMVGPNRSKRSLEDAIYASTKDADYDIPADSIPTGSSVPKSKSGLKKFFSMVGKGIGIKKKSRSNDEGSQSLYSGGTIRKFKGGSMNTLKENLVPQYKKGGNMPKGMPKEMMAMMGKKYKKGGEMSKHEDMAMDMALIKKMVPSAKKMDMAKPKASSMDQKFAKGGTARYASGGMCKGYGIAKKIRPTGSMN